MFCAKEGRYFRVVRFRSAPTRACRLLNRDSRVQESVYCARALLGSTRITLTDRGRCKRATYPGRRRWRVRSPPA
jgi:hypothetical protein